VGHRLTVAVERAEHRLAELPLGGPDYLRVLASLLAINNHNHTTKPKAVSDKTIRDRANFLFAFFKELRHRTNFNNLDPRSLANRHIEAMVARWVERGLSTATIHCYLSFLRTFGTWIGKPGMVQEPSYYVGEASPHAHRSQVARSDASWTAKQVDIAAKIEQVGKEDAWVGLQLALCYHFGLRAKEARHFRPHEAVISREDAKPADAAAHPEVTTFIRVVYGTKGGRARDIPQLTGEQRTLLEHLQKEVAAGQFVGHPGSTPAQAQNRFYYVLKKCGITKKDLGVVAHGLRHQHVNDLYEQHAGHPSPVRGAEAGAEWDDQARERATRVLGHNRLRVTNCYLGSPSSQARMRRESEEATQSATV